MIVEKMAKKYLIENEYDGLFNEEADNCGCLLKDFAPCGEISGICKAGYRHKGDEEAPWYIRPEKPKEKKK